MKLQQPDIHLTLLRSILHTNTFAHLILSCLKKYATFWQVFRNLLETSHFINERRPPQDLRWGPYAVAKREPQDLIWGPYTVVDREHRPHCKMYNETFE